MRIEKGHVAGAELNGQTTAHDLGLGRMMAMGKDFIGRALSQRPALLDPDRQVLVGVKPLDPSARLSAGAHFIALERAVSPENDEGHVTSVGFSPSLNVSIGLGLLKRGRERIGERLRAVDAVRGTDIRVEVLPDPASSTLKEQDCVADLIATPRAALADVLRDGRHGRRRRRRRAHLVRARRAFARHRDRSQGAIASARRAGEERLRDRSSLDAPLAGGPTPGRPRSSASSGPASNNGWRSPKARTNSSASSRSASASAP